MLKMILDTLPLKNMKHLIQLIFGINYIFFINTIILLKILTFIYEHLNKDMK